MSCVLLVDDDSDIRETLGLLLEDEGYEVVTAVNGEAALRLLQGGLRPGIMILDLMMPVMNGWELRAQMLSDPAMAAIPTIVVTGDPRAVTRAESLGAAAYLTKPFDADELLALVAGAMARADGRSA